MDFLTATILSGLIYDGVKDGATIGFDLLKSKLQGWLIDDNQIQLLVEQLKDAGINEDLAPHAIERKIEEHQPLTKLLKQIKAPEHNNCVVQTSHIGHNVSNNGNGSISIGDIVITKTSE
ncbi:MULTISPECIES: GapS6a family protein [Vibrio]|uniref:GapS6a family protein n=1 Tax=Vibrio TaxID=662 RepID=UPI001CDC38C9|nr:hypothetical protein [Vibrio vulnificus]EJL6514227.1 hypothetical protein [Vibrio cholerae]ELC9572656.1 hypothetical protein [Vibrio vulnificus]MCA3968224.1 hypothetical protein [Vibrio vulnificus]